VELAPHDTNGVNEGESIGIKIALQRGLVHEAANCKVGEKETVEFSFVSVR